MPKPKSIAQMLHDDYYQKEDPEGLVGLYFREQERIDKAYKAGELDYNFENSEFRATFWEEFLHDLAITKAPYPMNFVMQVTRAFKAHYKECTLDTGILYDETYQKVKGGGIEGVEGLEADDKLSETMSVSFMEQSTASGRLKKDFNIGVSSLLLDLNDGDVEIELNKNFSEANKEAEKNYRGMDSATKKRYGETITMAGDTYIPIVSSLKKEDGKNRSIRLKIETDADFKIKTLSNGISIVKEADDEKLMALSEKLKKEAPLLKAYESDVRSWANTAGSLLKEFEQNSTEEEKQTEQYNKLHDALYNASRLGRDADYIGVDGEKRSSDGYYDKATNYSFEKLTEALEDYPDNEFKRKIASSADEAKKKTDESLSKGADKVYREYEKTYPNLTEIQSKVFERDLSVIEAEKNRRIINSDHNKAGKEKIDTLSGEIDKVNKQIDNIVYFKMQARTSLLSVKTTFNYFDKDSAKRNLTSAKDRKKHKDYLDVVEKSKAVEDIDFYKETPAEVLKKLKEARAAADRYIKSHAGWKHPGSGFRDDGQDRIEKANRIRKNLDREIEHLQPLADNLSDEMLKGVSFAEWQKVLQEKNAHLRDEIKATKQNIIANSLPLVVKGIPLGAKNKSGGTGVQPDANNNVPVNLDDELKTAREIVKKSANDNGGMIDREECANALSRIATIATLKYEEKTTKKSVNMTKAEFNKMADDLKGEKKFERVLEVSSPKQLYNRAVEDKDLLRWIPDLNNARIAIESENAVKEDANKKKTVLQNQANADKKMTIVV